jgi:hypothetical protein
MQDAYAAMRASGLDRRLRDAESDRFWRNAQALLVAAANVSKAMWGLRGGKAEQRRPLRESLEVGDDSPLRPTTFRNHFEHIDQRIDQWWEEDERHNIVNTMIGPQAMVGGLPPISFFRQFDPATQHLLFWSDEFPLPEVIEEIQRILPIATREAAKPHGQPPSPHPQP